MDKEPEASCTSRGDYNWRRHPTRVRPDGRGDCVIDPMHGTANLALHQP